MEKKILIIFLLVLYVKKNWAYNFQSQFITSQYCEVIMLLLSRILVCLGLC